MDKLKLGVFGCGFWSGFQTAAWQELSDQVDIVALCDVDMNKSRNLAEKCGVSSYYDDPEQLFRNHQLDFVDIITDVYSHSKLARMAADRGVNVICQKPMAPTMEASIDLEQYVKKRGVSFFIHENFRWQTPMRELRKKLDEGHIGKPFKANVKFCSSFPVYDNQPALAELEQFILTDVGTHILDIARFLFGEASSLYCLTQHINPKIKGEDVANVFMEMGEGVQCYAEMSYASIWEYERFPETFVLIEGEKGSLYLGPDCVLSLTDNTGTYREKIKVRHFDWADPEYDLAHTSVYDCNKNILSAIQGTGEAETTGEDNLKTLRLVFDAYRSANSGEVIRYK